MDKYNKNLNENSNDEIYLKKYLNIFFKEKKLILTLTLITSIVGVTASLMKKPIWRGDFKIVTKNEKSDSFNKKILFNPLADLKNSIDNKTRLEILKSPSVLKPVYEYAKKNDTNLNLSYKKWISKKTIIKYDMGTNVLVVSYKDKNKELILSILNKIKNIYQEYSLSDKKKKLFQSTNFLTNQKKILSEKYEKSLAEFNSFIIENRLGNVDGFLAIEKNKNKNVNFSQSSSDLKQNKYPMGFQNVLKEENKTLQKYATQFENLERKEALYVQLSSKLKPNSNTLTNLTKEIAVLQEALERPNKILIKYRELGSTVERNRLLFDQVIYELELLKLENVKLLIPWEVISSPTVDELRESPKRKQIVLYYFLAGLLFSIIISILKYNLKGIVFEKEDFERYLDLKFDGYIKNDINLNTLLINKFKLNLKKGEKLAILKLEESGNEDANDKYFLKDSNIEFISINKLKDLDNYKNIILIAFSGKIKFNTLNIIKDYIEIYRVNIRGFLFKSN